MRFAAIVAVTLIVDQLAKFLISSGMHPGESLAVLPPVFYITYVLNPGAAFGILANQTNLFIGLSLAVIIGILIGYRYLPRERVWTYVGLGMLVGGALGNLLDRIRLGLVVDFLDFRVWPVFNLADTAIVVGVALLILDLWLADRKALRKVHHGAGD